jgi:hypothetical protein
VIVPLHELPFFEGSSSSDSAGSEPPSPLLPESGERPMFEERPVLFGLCVLEYRRSDRFLYEENTEDKKIEILADNCCFRIERLSPRPSTLRSRIGMR